MGSVRAAAVALAIAAAACGGRQTPASGGELPGVIYLARHGQTDWNRIERWPGDPDLDEVGYVNRLSLWRALRDRPLAAIYASSKLRSRRTAELIARQRGLAIRETAALNELDFGVAAGICIARAMPPARVTDRYRSCLVDAGSSNPSAMEGELRALGRTAGLQFAVPPRPGSLDAKLPLGESWNDVARRLGPFIRELGRHPATSEILIVGHEAANRALLSRLTGWPLERTVNLRQGNDLIYRIDGAGTAAARLSLYAPGAGWRPCAPPRRTGHRALDCHPKEEAR
jgi:broad specificity phosphatase PhoE